MSGTEQGRIHLYSVGIDAYSNYRRLRCCVNDAELVAQVFESKTNGARLTILRGTDVSGVLHADVVALLDQIGKLSLTGNDRVFFYFAGHGFSHDGADYLVCSDTPQAYPENGAIPTSDVIAALSSSGAGTSVFIIDACRNIFARDVGLFGKQTLELSRRQGVIVFSACSPGEVAQELPNDLDHGVFTYALTQTLTDGRATTPLEIDNQIIPRVETLCQEYKLERQVPYTSVFPLQKAVVDIFTGALRASVGRPRQCILVLGPSNAGKTRLGEVIASQYGFTHVEMSSFAWQRYREHRKIYDGSLQDYLEGVLWSRSPKDILVQDLLASDNGIDQLCVCGARRLEEVQTLQAQDWDMLTFFLYSDSRTRFDRWIDSGEASQDASYRDFVLKDLREYSWGLSQVPFLQNVSFVVNDVPWSDFQARIFETIEMAAGRGVR